MKKKNGKKKGKRKTKYPFVDMNKAFAGPRSFIKTTDFKMDWRV